MQMVLLGVVKRQFVAYNFIYKQQCNINLLIFFQMYISCVEPDSFIVGTCVIEWGLLYIQFEKGCPLFQP
jgi:hypothetical protein